MSAYLVIASIHFAYRYIHFRNYMRRYLYTYERLGNKYYIEDYSWKDSLVILLLLLIGIVVVSVVIYRMFGFK